MVLPSVGGEVPISRFPQFRNPISGFDGESPVIQKQSEGAVQIGCFQPKFEPNFGNWLPVISGKGSVGRFEFDAAGSLESDGFLQLVGHSRIHCQTHVHPEKRLVACDQSFDHLASRGGIEFPRIWSEPTPPGKGGGGEQAGYQGIPQFLARHAPRGTRMKQCCKRKRAGRYRPARRGLK